MFFVLEPLFLIVVLLEPYFLFLNHFFDRCCSWTMA